MYLYFRMTILKFLQVIVNSNKLRVKRNKKKIKLLKLNFKVQTPKILLKNIVIKLISNIVGNTNTLGTNCSR